MPGSNGYGAERATEETAESANPGVAAAPGKLTRSQQTASPGREQQPSPRSREAATRSAAQRLAPWVMDDASISAIGVGASAEAPSPATPSVPADKIPASKLAAGNSRKLAASIDALRKLDDAALLQRRLEARAQIAQPGLAPAAREQATREHDAVEFVCAERRLEPRADPRETEEIGDVGPMTVRLPERRPQMRAFLERQVQEHGSYQRAHRMISMLLNSELPQSSFAARQLGREQLAILDAEVAKFRKAFSIQAMQTARTMLDDGSRAIAAALAAYGLPVDTVRLTQAAEKMRDGEDASAASDWLTLAHSDEHEGRFQQQAPQRQALATQVDRLLQQQALITRLTHEQDRLLALRAQREHPVHQSRGSAAPPRQDLRGMGGMGGMGGMDGLDEARRAAARSQAQVAKLPPQLPVSPVSLPGEAGSIEQRLLAIGSRLRQSRLGLSAMWIEAERLHPILAAYRNGGSPDPAAAESLGSERTGGGDAQMRAALQQVMPKLGNILRAKSALASGDLSPLTLPPVIELARTQMLVPDGSARAAAVSDLVEEASRGGWKQWAIAAITLATTAIALVPTAGASVILATNLSALALDVYVAVESYEEYGLRSALTNTDLDQARSLSAEEPSLTDLAVKLVSLGLNTAVVTQLFREAVTVRRLALGGKASDDAVRALNATGESTALPSLAMKSPPTREQAARQAAEQRREERMLRPS